MDRIYKEDGQERTVNEIVIKADRNASYSATDKALSAYASQNGFRYENRAEENRRFSEEYTVKIMLNAALVGLILFIMVMIGLTFTSNEAKDYAARIVDAELIGMKRKSLRKMIFRNEAVRFSAVLSGTVIGLIVNAFLSVYGLFSRKGNSGGYSSILKDWTVNRPLLILESIIQNVRPAALIAVASFVLLTVCGYFLYLKQVKEKRRS